MHCTGYIYFSMALVRLERTGESETSLCFDPIWTKKRERKYLGCGCCWSDGATLCHHHRAPDPLPAVAQHSHCHNATSNQPTPSSSSPSSACGTLPYSNILPNIPTHLLSPPLSLEPRRATPSNQPAHSTSITFTMAEFAPPPVRLHTPQLQLPVPAKI